MGAGIGSVAHEAATTRSYTELAQSTALRENPLLGGDEGGGEDTQTATRRDWEALHETNLDVAAWLCVAGTNIDLPVVATHDTDDEAHYLVHDLWGSSSASGTPFMDWRCPSADGRHVCVYAHHMTSTEAMFSQLQSVYRQEEFGALGDLVWDTPQGSVRATPLCSLRVEASWQEIQRFDWGEAEGIGSKQDPSAPTPDEFRAWLAGIVSISSAKSPEAGVLTAGARRCITLVTCSSDLSRQPWRTLALWAC